ncbi:hypothetical protein QBC46DRAFT_359480 [Diplogelasinospora grovesii]|uniref:Uncharacterized protein n=1 Tax=Diplogelasinospora grovesii TaxID=303347 RepID=A0AAN6MUM6_9PEZI|nr:hypothetical protein QBC46DRAFT_359480 [Diplogelasinospora grovesii]
MNTHPATSALMHPQSLRQIHNETSSFSVGLTGSIQSSPSNFSAASGKSLSTQDGSYTHVLTPAQAATYALHAAISVEQQNPQMVSFQGQMAATPYTAVQVMTQQATPLQQQSQPVTYKTEAPVPEQQKSVLLQQGSLADSRCNQETEASVLGCRLANVETKVALLEQLVQQLNEERAEVQLLWQLLTGSYAEVSHLQEQVRVLMQERLWLLGILQRDAGGLDPSPALCVSL